MKKIFLGFSLFCVSTIASATSYQQANIEVDRLGGQSGHVFYMNFKEGFRTNCADGQIYCPANNDSCKYFYTLVVSAKLAGKKLLSADYTQDDVSRYCVLNGVQIN